MLPRRPTTAVAHLPARLLLVLVLVPVLVLPGCSRSGPPVVAAGIEASAAARAAAARFFASYVDPDGRVVRRDQGGDTVSEGQGYALLLAVAVGDRPRVDAVWGWTRGHLQRPDGLLSYLWRAGRVADPTPAADADTQVAWALALAGRRFGDQSLTEAGRRLALAVADQEVGYDDEGAPLLVAGPFGRGGAGRAALAEPGYWTGPAVDVLAQVTGDRRWQDMGATHARLLTQLTGQGARLPADWITVGAGSTVRAVPAPDGATVRCALDGQRTLVWSALDPRARSLAGRWWDLINADADAAPLARRLDGSVLAAAATPLAAVAAAAAAGAAGHPDGTTRLLARADDLASRYPTYYGSAWDALGRVLLTTDLLTR